MVDKSVKKTAAILLKIIEDAGDRRVWAFDLRANVRRLGGNPRLIRDAVKFIRDCGYKLCCDHRMGIWTQYWMAKTDAEIKKFMDERAEDNYSEAVSTARAFYGTSMEFIAQRRAITIGEWLGFSPQQVLNDCAPLKGI